MARLTFITGGARSGKSRFAEELLKNKDGVVYVATGIPFDEEMRERIAKHRSTRNSKWETIEAYRDIDKILKGIQNKDCLLIDCITIMVSNIMLLDRKVNWDNADAKAIHGVEKEVIVEIDKLLDAGRDFRGDMIIVSNELGMGVVPASPIGRHYRDIAGRVNQMIADAADTAYLLISGLPLKIKG